MQKMNAVPGDEEIPLVEHIKELRSRMVTAAVPIIITMAIAFYFSDEMLRIWIHTFPVQLNVYAPMEMLITQLSFSLTCALFLGIPLIVYEAFMFVGKGLYVHEKRFFKKIVPSSFILFTVGAVLGYFVVVPFVFKYAVLNSTGIATPQNSILKTFNLAVTLIVGFGILFQFPLLVVFAVKMGILKKESLKRKRMLIYGVFLAFSLFISPDPLGISGLIIAAALVVLFEISLAVTGIL
jgi:sec-independent protein translocase protein TatC